MKKNRRNGKVVIKNVVILFMILSALGAFMTFSSAKEEKQSYEYVVLESDTLWNISADICKKSDDNNLNVQKIVKEIKKLNNLDNSNIYEGQTIKLPIY